MKKAKRFLLITLALFLLLVIAGTGYVKRMEYNLNAFAQEALANVDLSTAKEGTFIGKYTVMPIDVEVQVKVGQQEIEEILLVKHFNGQGKAAETIPSQVVKAQSLQVDVIAGATYSSKVILKAIQVALLQAGATIKL